MRNKFATFALLFLAFFALSSCLGNDDDEYTYTDDTVITAFSVSGGKQYVYLKTSTGKDSLVIKSPKLSSYKFYIDQLKGEIYNPDSLPCGVDPKKLVCSVSTGYSSNVVIKSVTSDSVLYFSTSDSVDFSTERQLLAYSMSTKSVRKYKVRVNIHKEQPDSFAWHAKANCDELKRLTAVKAVALKNCLLLFGTNGTQTIAFAHDGTNWTQCTFNFNHTLAADAYKGVVAKNGNAFISDGGDIMTSADGSEWTLVAKATGVERLVAATPFRLYGYAADGSMMASTDNGQTWTASAIDDAITLLPTQETAYVSVPLKTNAMTDHVLLIGSRDNSIYPGDKNLTIWGKIDEGAEGSDNQPWAYYNITEDMKYAAPMLNDIHALPYDSAVYLLGSANGNIVPTLYKSRDNGITWKADTLVAMPEDFVEGVNLNDNTTAYAMTVDRENRLWIVNAKNGKTWCGRINRLGWARRQTAFTK